MTGWEGEAAEAWSGAAGTFDEAEISLGADAV